MGSFAYGRVNPVTQNANAKQKQVAKFVVIALQGILKLLHKGPKTASVQRAVSPKPTSHMFFSLKLERRCCSLRYVPITKIESSKTPSAR
jgi:hypothetical protein